MSQGPLICGSLIVSTTFPLLSRTIKQPACAVSAMPSEVGKLPTITHPLRNTTKESRQTNSSRTRAGKRSGVDLSKQAEVSGGRNLHNRCPRALEVAAGVKVANENVAFRQVSDSSGNREYSIRVDVSIARNSGRSGDDRRRLSFCNLLRAGHTSVKKKYCRHRGGEYSH